MGAAARFPAAQRRGRDAGAGRGERARRPRRRRDRGISRRDARSAPRRSAADAGGPARPRRGAAADALVQRQILRRGQPWLVREKIYKRFLLAAQGGGAPDMDAVRAARANMRYHLRYIGHSIGARNWLAGDRLTYADLAAAAHLSCVDYLGDAAWGENETAKALVRADQVAPVVPAAAGRAPAGHAAEPDLRRSRLLSGLSAKARALGFDACRIAARRAAAPARATTSRPGSPPGRTATWPGWPRPSRAAPIPRRCGRRRAASSCWR